MLFLGDWATGFTARHERSSRTFASHDSQPDSPRSVLQSCIIERVTSSNGYSYAQTAIQEACGEMMSPDGSERGGSIIIINSLMLALHPTSRIRWMESPMLLGAKCNHNVLGIAQQSPFLYAVGSQTMTRSKISSSPELM